MANRGQMFNQGMIIIPGGNIFFRHIKKGNIFPLFTKERKYCPE